MCGSLPARGSGQRNGRRRDVASRNVPADGRAWADPCARLFIARVRPRACTPLAPAPSVCGGVSAGEGGSGAPRPVIPGAFAAFLFVHCVRYRSPVSAHLSLTLSHSLTLLRSCVLTRSDTVSSRSRARMWERRAIGHSALTRRLNIVATPNSTGTQTHKLSTFSFTHLLTLTLTLTLAMWSWCWCW